MLYANAIYQTSVEVAERSVKETTNTARIKYLCTAPGLYFLSKYWIPNLVLHFFSFLRERTPGHPWMQIFIISFNWQGCRKIFEIPLPTQLWGTIFIYTTSSYHYSPLASWCSVMQWKNPLFCVTFHIVSGPSSACSVLISESKLKELYRWLHWSFNPRLYLYVETSFQGLPDKCKGVSTSLLVPNDPWFIASSKTQPKELCQTFNNMVAFLGESFPLPLFKPKAWVLPVSINVPFGLPPEINSRCLLSLKTEKEMQLQNLPLPYHGHRVHLLMQKVGDR